jgi:hypothetical protein
MGVLLKLGRVLFGLATALFGLVYLIDAIGLKGPLPGAPWSHGPRAIAWLVGLALVAAGISIVIEKLSRLAALLLGTGIFLKVLLYHAADLITHLHNPGSWTPTFELLGICGAAWVLAEILPPDATTTATSKSLLSNLAVAGRLLFAASLLVFAVQHFLYAAFVATLITAWIPAHLFFAYFTGAAFVAAAVAIATRIKIKLAAALLGSMFLLWVLVLHISRVAVDPHNGDEVTSLIVCLAFSGAGFILAESRS